MIGPEQISHRIGTKANASEMRATLRSHFQYLPIDQFNPLIVKKAEFTHPVVFLEVPSANLRFDCHHRPFSRDYSSPQDGHLYVWAISTTIILTMPTDAPRKFTMADLRLARDSGRKVPILTCYDYTTAGLMQEAGVPALLVGDSAANVILGHPNTLPITLSFLMELTAAVRRGAPRCLVIGDMPFGTYQASVAQGVKNVLRTVQLSGCDCVKIEAA